MEPQSGPTQFYSLAFCVHIISYICTLIAAFTPDWSAVTESNGGVDEDPYDKGIFISCKVPGGSTGCGFNKDVAGSSTVFFACFFVVIAYIVIGFFAFQLLVAGVCVRSLREKNLGIPLVLHFVLLILLVILAIVLFEVSITKDITTGNEYEEHTFGLSRYLLVAAVVLYFICTFFALGEYFKRKGNNSISQATPFIVDSIPPTPKSKHENNDSRSNSNLDTKSNNISRTSDISKDNNIKNNNNNNNNNIEKSNASIVSTNERKFSKKENRPPIEYDKNYKTSKRASTSIIPLQGLSYYR